MELLEAFEEYGIDETATLLNEIIYDTGQTPLHISKSITPPKKQGHSIGHITKIRGINKTQSEIAERQCDFVGGKGTNPSKYY